MGPFKAVGACYLRMLNFSGRARRAEYWWFFTWQFLLSVGGFAAGIYYVIMQAQTDPQLAAILSNPDAIDAYFANLIAGHEITILAVYLIGFALPNLSVTVRRLHDTNRSGWNIFMPAAVALVSGIIGVLFLGASLAGGSAEGAMLAIFLVNLPTLIASIWFVVWLCLPGSHGDNRFGGDPIKDRPDPEPAHPAFAGALTGQARTRVEAERRAAAKDYYKTRVLPSIQKA